jgi:hypothetical protein
MSEPFIDTNEGFTLVVDDGHTRPATRLELALRAQRDTLGNELAQERAKPGGSFDEAAFEQAQGEIEGLQTRLDAVLPIIAALALYGERVNVASLVAKARELNEAGSE